MFYCFCTLYTCVRYIYVKVWREVVCDAVRREPMPIGILQGDGILVHHLLKWMHAATELAPKSLRRRLANFITQLWSSSREAMWHLPEWKKHRDDAADELRAMAAFCTMLLNSQVSSCVKLGKTRFTIFKFFKD